MFRTLDWLILRAFVGPFIITFAVVTFLLESVFLMRYIEDFMGKDIGGLNFARLVFYFSLNFVPRSLPLGILVSSLITFGNLGEHRELTAIKASGISLTRIIRPIFLVVVGLSVGLYYFSNKVVPWGNLEGYRLLYDIRQSKPALDFKEGAFYAGLEDFSIRVAKKDQERNLLYDVIIYDHSGPRGNHTVTTAKRGKMYTIMDDRYLVLELFDGHNYNEVVNTKSSPDEEYVRSAFKRNKVVFSLAGFDMQETDVSLFKGHNKMKNVKELVTEQDSMLREIDKIEERLPGMMDTYFLYLKRFDSQKTLSAEQYADWQKNIKERTKDKKLNAINLALNQSRNAQSMTRAMTSRIENIHKSWSSFGAMLHSKFSMPINCIIMFLIGAPIGAIIKKGGLGIPLLISILFFILFYVIDMLGTRWSKEDVLHPIYGLWMANAVLLPIGIYFMRLAYKDANLALFNPMPYLMAFFRKLQFWRGAKNS